MIFKHYSQQELLKYGRGEECVALYRLSAALLLKFKLLTPGVPSSAACLPWSD